MQLPTEVQKKGDNTLISHKNIPYTDLNNTEGSDDLYTENEEQVTQVMDDDEQVDKDKDAI